MKYSALPAGTLATLALLFLYGFTMTILAGWEVALEQFQALWYFMVPLSIGFGVQVGLYMKLKEAIQQKARGALTTSGTSASVGMLACCAHHATDVLPILGLSAATTLVAQYQVPILSVSILINVVGIGIMWKHVKEMV